jgi:protein-L-isoaspartate O-methyltransferase
MRSKDIKKSIDALASMVSTIRNGRTVYKQESNCGRKIMASHIRNMMDGKLKRLKILEICSNAGYYSAMMANTDELK